MFKPSIAPPSNSLKTISLLTFIEIEPFEALTTLIPVLDFINDEPSLNLVKDPLKLDVNSVFVVLLNTNPLSPAKLPPSLNWTCVFKPPGFPVSPPDPEFSTTTFTISAMFKSNPNFNLFESETK